jgi:hypothetical protein
MCAFADGAVAAGKSVDARPFDGENIAFPPVQSDLKEAEQIRSASSSGSRLGLFTLLNMGARVALTARCTSIKTRRFLKSRRYRSNVNPGTAGDTGKESAMENAIFNWIAEESPWLRFAVDTQLLGKPSGASAALHDPKIQAVVRRLMDPVLGLPAIEPGKVNYTCTGNAFWDLFFLADIGLQTVDVLPPGALDAFWELQRGDGTFVLQDGTKPGYFCIPAIILSSHAKMGHAGDPHILRFPCGNPKCAAPGRRMALRPQPCKPGISYRIPNPARWIR